MREQRRHVSMVVSPLEMLDDRIVPSVMGSVPTTAAPLANHHSHHHANHVHAHVSRAHAAHRIVLAPGIGNALARATQAAAAASATPSAVTAQSSTAASGNPVIAQTSGASNTPSTTSTPTVAVVATAPATSGSGGNPSSGPSPTSPTSPGGSGTPSVTPSLTDLKSGPLAKAGQDLIAVYQEFQQHGGGDSFTSSEAARIQFQGANVGFDAVSTGGNFDAFVSAMTSLGMQVTRTDASHSLVEGFLPISRLPDAAQNPLTLNLSPIYRPELLHS
jgi:hypothetical protein